jgi:uncharacterized membrane protein
MPYRWTDAEGHAVPSPASDSTTAADQLHLWPYRSLPRKGFVFFIVATVAMISLPLFAVLGRVELWWLLPFIALAVAGVWWAISHSYRTGEVLEVLSFRVEMHPSGGPVPDYLTLRGGTREVEIGAFLTPEERRQLHRELQLRLDQARAPAAS